MLAKVREQGRLAAARCTSEANIAIADGRTGVGEQFFKYRLTAAEHKAFAALRDECLHP